ncbi:hypothetical protein WMF37_50010 [Sorangium sp. So ce291]|uniref:hypothetical protein n=1 Tax=Sorangium sp. So ce291 TaxID=3133294 RepID=UPI003F605860
MKWKSSSMKDQAWTIALWTSIAVALWCTSGSGSKGSPGVILSDGDTSTSRFPL